MPTASAPRSPAKSGSHSAIVEPISAWTLSPAASIALRNATPSGMCEARMITYGRPQPARPSRAASREREAVGHPRDDRHASLGGLVAAASATDRA